MSNAELFDDMLEASIDIERYGAGTARKIRALLRKVEKEVTAEIADMEPWKPRSTDYRRTRLENLNQRIDKIVSKGYGEIEEVVTDDLVGAAQVSSAAATSLLAGAVRLDLDEIGWTQEQLRQLVKRSTVDGGLIGEWMGKKAENLQTAIKQQLRLTMDEINAGLIKGDALGELIRRVRGTSTQPGAYFQSYRHAEAYVRTATAQIAHDAQMEAFKEHKEVISGYRIVATLDERTTPLCRAYDGLEYTKTFKPLGHTRPYPRPGGPPFHWNCRSILVPITKTWDELSKSDALSEDQKTELELMGSKDRAALGGQFLQHKTYDDWLQTQPMDRQIRVLGKARYELWKKFRLNMVDLVNQRGRPLTIQQLVDKYVKQKAPPIEKPAPSLIREPTVPKTKPVPRKEEITDKIPAYYVEARSLEEAQAWAEQNIRGAKQIEFTGIDLDIANQINKTVKEISEKFGVDVPKILPMRKFDRKMTAPMAASRAGMGYTASYWTGPGKTRLMEYLKKTRRATLASSDPEAYVAHEMGHILQQNTSALPTYLHAEDVVKRNAKAYRRKLGQKGVKAELSDYAWNGNPSMPDRKAFETWAEAFSAWWKDKTLCRPETIEFVESTLKELYPGIDLGA